MKIINLKIFTILILTLIGCSSSESFLDYFQDHDQIPDSDQLMMKVMDEAVQEIRKEYQACPIGFGMSKPEKFKSASIEFQIFRKLTKDQARSMLLHSIDIFLDKINSNEDLKNYLVHFPFSRKDVSITFYIEGGKGEEIVHPDVCVASWHSHGLDFHTDDPVTQRFKETYEETHEEALELVKQYRASQVASSK